MKRIALSLALFCGCTVFGQSYQPLFQTFTSEDVQLLPGIFKDAETTDLNYILALNPDKLLAPYLREAGLTPKTTSYTNWENTGLDGHIGGHYISALSLMYAATHNQKVLDRLKYMLLELKKCQDKNGNGYVGGVPGSQAFWPEIEKGNIALMNKKWVPIYNIHKMFAGLRDAYLYTQNPLAKEMLVKFADWFVHLGTVLTEKQMQQMLNTEHGGPNEVLADVYALTGDKKYLTAAYQFSHQSILMPLEKHQDKLTNLHANTQIPKIIGFKRIADLEADSLYNNAAQFFWETVVTHRTLAFGGNSVREHFNPANNFSGMLNSEQGPETCNSYNMLKLTKMLYQSNGSPKYIDYYERTLYNHILSTQEPEKGGFVYFTPIRPGHYRVYSQPQTSMWCCVGSGMENHAKYHELIYAHNSTDVFVNLFIPSRLTWKEKGLVLTQNTNFPENENSTITIESAKTTTVTNLQIRYPNWVAAGAMQILVNGKNITITALPGSYVAIKQVWKKGDKISIRLPMQTTTEALPDGSNYIAVLHGPIVLAAKTSTEEMTGLYANDSRGGHIAGGKQYALYNMPMFVSNTKNIASFIKPVAGKNFTFSAEELIYPTTYKKLELIPFYKLHNARYMLYWQQETPESYAAVQQKGAEKEQTNAKLAAATIDMVTPGEQQPESDHFIESDNSNIGTFNNRHWRDAKGWFSYQLKNTSKTATALQVMYYGADKRHFFIEVNNIQLADVQLDGSKGNNFFTVNYPLPVNYSMQEKLTVKFVAAPNSVAGGVFEVRLLKNVTQ